MNYNIVSNGTDNHLIVLDLTKLNLPGKEAEQILEQVGISVSRSTIPNDPRSPVNPSGIRIGTPAITTRGMRETEVKQIAKLINKALKKSALDSIKKQVKELCNNFPIPN